MLLGSRVSAATLVAAGVLAAMSSGQSSSVAVPARFSQVLTKQFQFSASDVAALSHGSIVVKSLPAFEPREVVVAGAFWCDVPLTYFLSRASDIVTFKRVKEVQQIGVFGRPARAADLSKLTLEGGDVDALRHCEPGDCKFKLDRAGLERMRHEVGWATPAAAAQAQGLARDVIARYVAEYQRGGNGALIEYADADVPVKIRQGTETLLNRALWLHEAAPGLRQYADAFPRDPMPQAQDVIYWSKETIGSLKPMISATHTILWRKPGGTEGAILAKQVYASHYLDASISMTWLVSDGRAVPGGIFVVYQNRSLVDLLQGLFGPLRRSIARSRTKDGLMNQLEGLKKRLEADFRSTGGAPRP
jgi:hypothetical protein